MAVTGACALTGTGAACRVCSSCAATADLGLIAYETAAREGLVLDEGVIVEIVRPGTGDPVPDGEVGEVVVTTLNPDYPLIRFGTGDLSALENLQIAAAVAGRPLDEATALAALRRIGLAGREDLPSRVLSQGQKRRVALARLLCSQARLWVLDEPFVALDVAAVDQLCNILDEHLARGGLLLFTSHQAVHLAGSGGSLRLGR